MFNSREGFRMNCNVHHEKEANFRCFECGAFICNECAVEKDGKTICRNCLSSNLSGSDSNQIRSGRGAAQNSYVKRYNAFLAFIFSLIPGAGQMYLGLMKRGLQLMVLFTIPIVITNLFYFGGWLVIFNVIIWFYSLFDCLHIKRAINRGEEIKDEFVYDIKMLDLNKLNYKHLGIGLIVGGVLVILNNGLSTMTGFLRNHSIYGDEIYRLFRFIRQSSFPVLLIIVGVYLLKKSKIKKEA